MRYRKTTLFLVLLLIGWPLSGTAQNKTQVTIKGATDQALKVAVENNLSSFLTTLNRAFATDSTLASFDEAIMPQQESVLDLWNNVPFRCPFTELAVDLLQTSSGFEVRNIPLVLKAFDREGKNLQQQGVVQFDQNGRIAGVNFALKEHQYDAIFLNAQGEVDIERRMVILNFVESVRTAYNRKDLPLIEQVYSDNALIIIGRVIEEQARSSVGTPQITYVRRKKSEYLAQLREVFAANEYINVDFEEIKVLRHPVQDDIYGVTLLQYWNSSNYSDAGYLFLMIDFAQEERPIIHVRTWQPKVEVNEEDVFQLNDFWINRRSN